MNSDPFGFVGATIENRYRVDGVVGEGGFGVVYRCWHLAFRHAVAIKCLKIPAHYTSEAQGVFLDRFREEGAMLSRLSQHPSVVRVFDFGVTKTPMGAAVPYMVLEWLDGVPLDQFIAERRGAPMDADSAVALLRGAIEALAFAHDQSPPIAHRDVKPANIFVLGDPKRGPLTKVLDFGIAKAMQEGEDVSQLRSRTSSGFSAFSPTYGAPEQFASKKFGGTSPRTDVHALGLVLCELMVGQSALAGDEFVDYLQAAMDARRPTPRARGGQTSDAMESVLARALALQPRDRFATAGELLHALDAARATPVATSPQRGTVPFEPMPPSPTGVPVYVTQPPAVAGMQGTMVGSTELVRAVAPAHPGGVRRGGAARVALMGGALVAAAVAVTVSVVVATGKTTSTDGTAGTRPPKPNAESAVAPRDAPPSAMAANPALTVTSPPAPVQVASESTPTASPTQVSASPPRATSWGSAGKPSGPAVKSCTDLPMSLVQCSDGSTSRNQACADELGKTGCHPCTMVVNGKTVGSGAPCK